MIYTHVLNRPDIRVTSPLDRLELSKPLVPQREPQRVKANAKSASTLARPEQLPSAQTELVVPSIVSDAARGEASIAEVAKEPAAKDLVHLRTKAAPEIAVLTKPPRMLQRFKMALAQLMNSRFAITTQNCRILALRVDQAHQRTIRADLGPVRTCRDPVRSFRPPRR